MLIANKLPHEALSNATENLKLEIFGSELDIVTQTRDLGVQVDKRFDYIKATFSKLSRSLEFPYERGILLQTEF